jgi:hypothetical protein
MPRRRWRRGLVLAGTLLALVLGGLALAAWALPESRAERRQAAQRRWEARPFSSYRVTVELRRLNTRCVEELIVSGEQVAVLQDNCSLSWLPHMTVPSLFELGRRLERSPECFPPAACACERIRRGRIVYDEQLGFPREIVIRRTYRPNWHHLDYWRYFWREWELPTCSTGIGGVTATVLDLTPLD